MKTTLKTSVLLTLIAIMASGCGQTSSTTNKKKTSSTSTTNPSTTNPTTPTTPGSGSGSVSGCDGIYNANASRCYFTELPKFILSGQSSTTPVNNVSLWSSENSLHRGGTFDEENFSSDGNFKIRFKPTGVGSGNSLQGKVCSTSMGYQFTKAKIYFMLRRKGYPFTTVYEAVANINSYSPKISLPTVSGASQYVLEVMGIETNHRCYKDSANKYVYGTPNNSTIAACNAGTYFGTMPLASGPTSCTAINIEFSTDSTYELP